MQQLGNPELKKLAEGLPHTVVGSQADSTVAKYLRAFQRWKNWVARHTAEISVYPVKEADFALYLQYLAETSKSKATVDEAVNTIAWVQQLADHQPVSASPFICATLAGLHGQIR